MSRWATLGLVVVLASTGCGDDNEVVPEGDYYQYVVGDLRIPENRAEVQRFGLDLNGDAAIDNQLGTIFALLEDYDFGVADTVHESLVRGNAIMLVELQTLGFDDTRGSGLQTALGANPVPAACSNPRDLTTCGQHFATQATYDVVPDSASPVGAAGVADGELLAPIGRLPIAIGLDPAAPLRVDLVAAKIRLTEMSPGHATAVISGGITTEDIEAVVVPEIARNVARIVGTDCGRTDEPTQCGCPPGARGKLLLNLFDSDYDCAVTAEEVATNTLVKSLFAPDLRIDGRELLSFGIGADLVSAAFVGVGSGRTAPDRHAERP